MADALIGKVLGGVGGYRVERLLGQGGMGAVYEGIDTQTGRPVAIKTVLRTLSEDPEIQRRFEREAQLAAEIDHPNVARVMRHGVDEDVRYMVMEYIDGKPLRDVVEEKGRIAGSRCIDYVRQAARGLQAAYQKGIIHRDIKPENLMLTNDGIVKIVDFGLARSDKGDSFKTATGAVMGTAHYISPEQASGMNVDHRSDIYSLGATFYHLLAGRPPFGGDSAFAVIQKHISEPVRDVKVWNPNVPEQVAQIVYRMLEKHPDRRFQTYGHLISTLDDAMEGKTTHTFTMTVMDSFGPDPETLAAEAEKARTRTILVAGVLLLGALAAFAYVGSRPDAEPEAELEAADPTMDKSKWKSETAPVLHDIMKFNKEMDESEKSFDDRPKSRREQMNQGSGDEEF